MKLKVKYYILYKLSQKYSKKNKNKKDKGVN